MDNFKKQIWFNIAKSNGDQLRTEGHMVYINQTSNGTSYRLGTPTKSILAAGASKIFKKSMREIVAAGIKSLYGTQKYAYSNR